MLSVFVCTARGCEEAKDANGDINKSHGMLLVVALLATRLLAVASNYGRLAHFSQLRRDVYEKQTKTHAK